MDFRVGGKFAIEVDSVELATILTALEYYANHGAEEVACQLDQDQILELRDELEREVWVRA